MAEITTKTAPERRELSMSDKTGETFVIIKPPDFRDETIRGRLTSKREYVVDDDGYMNVKVDVNTRLLWAEEIWLTYVESNLVVKRENEDGNVETITFPPKGELNRAQFMEKLEKVPPKVVWEWHAMVTSVIPEWRDPF